MRRLPLCWLFISLLWLPASGWAIDFFFIPDTTFGNVGDTITLSGQIGPSEMLRSFTIYIYNDTNQVDLADPPTAGSLISGQEGLDFRYGDHIPSAPEWLSIGATVFSTDYWAGPGELFQARFVLRECGHFSFAATVGFRRPDNSYIDGNYNPPDILVCAGVPQSVNSLIIAPLDQFSVILRWNPVMLDTSGNPLPSPPAYAVMRLQVLPTPDPPVNIATVLDTFLADPLGTGTAYNYYIVTQSGP